MGFINTAVPPTGKKEDSLLFRAAGKVAPAAPAAPPPAAPPAQTPPEAPPSPASDPRMYALDQVGKGSPGQEPPGIYNGRMVRMAPPQPTMSLNDYAYSVDPKLRTRRFLRAGTVKRIQSRYRSYLQEQDQKERSYDRYAKRMAAEAKTALPKAIRVLFRFARDDLNKGGVAQSRSLTMLNEMDHRGMLSAADQDRLTKLGGGALERAAVAAVRQGKGRDDPIIQAYEMTKSPGTFFAKKKAGKKGAGVKSMLPRPGSASDNPLGIGMGNKPGASFSAAKQLAVWDAEMQADPVGGYLDARGDYEARLKFLAPEGTQERQAFEGFLQAARPSFEEFAQAYQTGALGDPAEAAAKIAANVRKAPTTAEMIRLHKKGLFNTPKDPQGLGVLTEILRRVYTPEQQRRFENMQMAKERKRKPKAKPSMIQKLFYKTAVPFMGKSPAQNVFDKAVVPFIGSGEPTK